MNIIDVYGLDFIQILMNKFGLKNDFRQILFHRILPGELEILNLGVFYRKQSFK